MQALPLCLACHFAGLLAKLATPRSTSSPSYVSAKITAVALDGKCKTLTRARAQRLVDSGSHEWQGERTVREVKQAAAVSPVQNRIVIIEYPGREYPDQERTATPCPKIPYNYPLPYSLLKMYESLAPAEA